MARPAKRTTLASLAGKMGLIRREVQQVLRGLEREIARRGKELAELKAEYGRATALLRGRGAAAEPAAKSSAKPTAARRPRRRARSVNWERIFQGLPARFKLEALAKHPVAGKRPKSHLYAIVSRWKKAGKLQADPAGGYRKAGAPAAPKAARPKSAKPRRAARPRPAKTEGAKSAPGGEPSAA